MHEEAGGEDESLLPEEDDDEVFGVLGISSFGSVLSLVAVSSRCVACVGGLNRHS